MQEMALKVQIDPKRVFRCFKSGRELGGLYYNTFEGSYECGNTVSYLQESQVLAPYSTRAGSSGLQIID